MPAPHSRYWSDHTSEALARMDRERLIAVLPVSATEQQQAVIADANVFEVLMDAVRCCSLGQITNALFEVGGQYRRSR